MKSASQRKSVSHCSKYHNGPLQYQLPHPPTRSIAGQRFYQSGPLLTTPKMTCYISTNLMKKFWSSEYPQLLCLFCGENVWYVWDSIRKIFPAMHMANHVQVSLPIVSCSLSANKFLLLYWTLEIPKHSSSHYTYATCFSRQFSFPERVAEGMAMLQCLIRC